MHRRFWGSVAGAALLVLLINVWPAGHPADAAPPAQGAPGQGTATATPGGCPPSWQIVPHPDPGAINRQLFGVAVVAENDAWAVGFYDDAIQSTLITHWDGTAWTQVPSPNPGTSDNILSGIAAVSANDIWAVGNVRSTSGATRTLTLHWDGTAWSVVPSPNLGALSSGLEGVSVLSANDVWAVGWYYDSGGVRRTMVTRWNGATWSIIGTPNYGAADNILYGVAALAANNVWVAGSYRAATGPDQTLIMRWDGAGWVQATTPSPGPDGNALYEISALGQNDIWAVGTALTGTTSESLILRWDGVFWTRATSPSPAPRNTLLGVVARAANDVWAVGNSSSGGVSTPLTVHWDGSAWTAVPAPGPGAAENTLNAVHGRPGGALWAVGATSDNGILRRTLVERYSTQCPAVTATPGTPSPTRTPTISPTPNCALAWNVLTSPNVDVNNNNLLGVAAVSANDVWAVGYYIIYTTTVGTRPNHPNITQTLIQHWNGTAWSVVPSPNVGNESNRLQSVAAVSANNVWAVGYYEDEDHYPRTLILHWNGAAWSVVASPNASGRSNILYGVAARSTTDVWAVGGYEEDPPSFLPRTLILHWNGLLWTTVSSPNTASRDNYLRAVSIAGANDAWAVGWHTNGMLAVGMLLLHWDGTQWSIVPGAGVNSVRTQLYGVAARAANDVWAVGFALNPSTSALESLIIHWDGTAWTQVPSPSPDSYVNTLAAVDALAANDAWAVGTAGSLGAPLMLHWNGATWSRVPAPSVGATGTYPAAVDARTATEVWATGYFDQGGVSRTLVERYSNPCATPPPTGSPTPCPIQFTDVPSTNPFYPFIRCLACRQIVSGYADGTFRWGADVTRGQLSKILANAAGLVNNIPSTQQTFSDVPPNQTFWLFIERLAGTGAISGYACGGPGEPCDPQNRPYFRWGANATRGQIAKITGVTAGWNGPIPTTQQTFADVPPTNPFWLWIEELADRQIISGYTCGGPGEPCDPQSRPYFRWGNQATRGQMSKIAATAFYPNCSTPARR